MVYSTVPRVPVICSMSSTKSTAQLDSHADTCCVGPSAYIVHDTMQTVSVHAFVDSVGKVDNVPIVTAALAYDCPNTFTTYILFFYQALFFKDLKDHLLCPSQLRYADIIVNDTPLSDIPIHERSPQHHSILTKSAETPMHIPLRLHGVISYFDVRKPTQDEILSEHNCVHIHMTSDTPWDPHDPTLADEEDAIRLSLDPIDPVRGQASVTHSLPVAPRSISLITTMRSSAALDVDSFAPTFDISSTKTTKRQPSSTA